jgi:hypothetical protein
MPDESPTDSTTEDTGTEGSSPRTADATESGRDALEERMSSEVIRRINRLVPGTLTFHFPHRDVSFDMRGADAARLLTAHKRGRPDDLADDLDPDSSLMLLDWMSVALDTALMISWAAGPDALKVVSAGLADQDRRADKEATPSRAAGEERPAS